MHQGFRVVIQLKTPAIVSSMLTLDAVLAAAKYRETGDLELSHNALPLSLKDECWCASVIQFERGAFTRMNWLGKLTTKDMHEDNFTDRNRRGQAMVETGGGDYAAKLDKHLAWAGSVSFSGVGDPDEVVRLILTLHGLGAKSQQGCGTIESVEWSPLETDGLCTENQGRPLRPIPVSLWKAWGMDVGPGIAVDMASWAPPYWGTPKTMCVLPITVS